MSVRLAIAGSVAVGLFALVASDDAAGIAILIWSIMSTASIWWTLRRQSPQVRRGLRTLTWTAGLTVVGFVVRDVHGDMVGREAPIPSPADFLHIPAYVLFFVTILRVHRARSGRSSTDAWLDAMIMSSAMFVILWTSFLGDFTFNASLPLEMRAVNSIYTAIILASLTLFLRASVTPGERPPSHFLLGTAAFSYMVTDLAATFSLQSGSGLSLSVTLSPFVYGLAAAALSHPSCAVLLDRQEESELRIGRLRLTILGAAIASPAVILIFEPPEDLIFKSVLSLAVVVLTSLVMARVFRLLRFQQESASLERNLAAEVSGLAALDNADEIARELPQAAERLLPGVQFDPNAKLRRPDLLEPTGTSPTVRVKLLASDTELAERDRRLLDTLLRDAKLVAESTEARAAEVRRRSQDEANKKLAISERRFRALVQNASDLVVVLGSGGVVTYMSESVERSAGYQAADFEGKHIDTMVYSSDQASAAARVLELLDNDAQTSDSFEVRIAHKDGSLRLLECTATDMTMVEGVEGVVINATDVTEVRTLEENLLNAETTDALTLMLNRSAFIDAVRSALRRASLSHSSIAATIINLDDFRTINEGLGPALADQVLIEVAQVIRQSVRLSDSVARLSGDEFAVLMPGNYSADEAMASVERILESISVPLAVGGKQLRLTATAGVVVEGDPADADGETVLRNADTALDHAKLHNRGMALLYEEAMGEAASERVEVRNSLDTAITSDEMRLVYQPIVDIATGRIVSMEGLARWEHPVRGPISPGVFIPIAETSGFIHTLGAWALESACRQVVTWEQAGVTGFTVSVNLSGHQLRRAGVIDTLRRIVKNTGVDPTRIIIEITESVLIDDSDFIADRIRAIRKLGLKLAIDDFGTGYSSLSYLQRYDFDILKIDRSFIEKIGTKGAKKRREVVRSIVSLAQGLDATAVAEGVEDLPEHNSLRDIGCQLAQGYFYHRPLEADTIPEVIVANLKTQAA